MKALVYGVRPEPYPVPEGANPLTENLATAGRIDLRPMLTHTFGLGQWRDAFLAIANQGDSGAVKVAIDQRQPGRAAR
jgi:threonine dehydrogenase-like Zn-dependent dehydrogenase